MKLLINVDGKEEGDGFYYWIKFFMSEKRKCKKEEYNRPYR